MLVPSKCLSSCNIKTLLDPPESCKLRANDKNKTQKTQQNPYNKAKPPNNQKILRERGDKAGQHCDGVTVFV
eukprot:m.183615 g.183615  ORF g.183615 m.183615 type:complete len:72 (+) comp32163_c3_seq1:2065-2280(+)